MRAILAFSLLLCFGAHAFADDVSFAAPARPASSDRLSLADVMVLIQMRHTKLWFASRAKNWQLTSYELSELNDAFAKAAMLYINIPVDYIVAVHKPLQALTEGAAQKNRIKFERAFTDLQSACNLCHQAAGVNFISIQTPTSNPFNDQNFLPSPAPRRP
jgi:hypothetical protein